MFTPGSQLPQGGMSQITKPGEDLLFKLLQNIPAEKLVQGEQNAASGIGQFTGGGVSPTSVGNIDTLVGMYGGGPEANKQYLMSAVLRKLQETNPALGMAGEIATDPTTYLTGGVGGAAKAGALLGALGGVVRRGSPIAAKAAMEAAQVGSKTAPLTASLGSKLEGLMTQNPEILDAIGKQIAEKKSGLKQFGKQSDALNKLATAKTGTAGANVIQMGGPVNQTIDPAILENAKRLQQTAQQGDKFVQMMQRPVAQQGVQQIEPGKLEQIRAYINAKPVRSLIGAASGAAGVGAIPNLMVGGYSPQAQPAQQVRTSGAQVQGDFAKGFTPGVASGIAGNLQKQQEQAVGKSAQQQGVSPQELLMRIAKAILMQGGGGASVDQIADLIYKSGALGQQDKYREAQIQEMGSREARTNAAIQMSRQNIEEKYNNAMMMASMNPGDQKLAEAARKAREERDAKLAEFDQRVYGAQQAGAQ